MTQREKDFKELEDLKQQFVLLDEKLDKQRIISEEIVGEAIKEKLSHIERWYRKRFSVSLVSAPIVGIVFLVMIQVDVDQKRNCLYTAFLLPFLVTACIEAHTPYPGLYITISTEALKSLP